MSYHKIKITKHEHDSPFKIGEEYLEFLDSIGTNNPIMAIQELSDLYGCIELQAKKLGVTMDNLKKMSDLTREVFLSGSRNNTSLYESITSQSIKIGLLDDIAVAFMPNDFIYMFNHEASYSNDHMLPDVEFIVELVQGTISIDIGETNSIIELTKENQHVLLANIKNEIEYHFGNNSILKIKYFNAKPLIDDFEESPHALKIIKDVCELKEFSDE